MPQGSGLGPTQFIAYTENTTTDIFQKHGIQYHLFADDTQMYSFSQVRDAPALLSRLSDCIGELATSYASIVFSWMLQKVNLYGLVLGRYYLKYLNSFIK